MKGSPLWDEKKGQQNSATYDTSAHAPNLYELELAIALGPRNSPVANLHLSFLLLLLDHPPESTLDEQPLDLLHLPIPLLHLPPHALLLPLLPLIERRVLLPLLTSDNGVDPTTCRFGPSETCHTFRHVDRVEVVGFLQVEEKERTLEGDELREVGEVGGEPRDEGAERGSRVGRCRGSRRGSRSSEAEIRRKGVAKSLGAERSRLHRGRDGVGGVVSSGG